MLNIFKEILRNYKDNQRHIYPEPPVERYDKQFYSDLYTPEDKVNYMLSLWPIPSKARILDIGCGRGELLFEVAKKYRGEGFGVDYSQEAIAAAVELAKKNARHSESHLVFRVMDSGQLDFPNEFFDGVFMADIVEHLSDQKLSQSLAEAFRVLKKGGRLILHTEPTVNYKRFGQYFAKYYFGRKGIPWMTPSIREESLLTHINIQSEGSLKGYLQKSFSKKKIKVFYSPIHGQGFLKQMISVLGLWALFSPHLWATAEK